ncbi:MAG: tetratricopeptide repeat protein, partial [Promethearchaeota archaeon]
NLQKAIEYLELAYLIYEEQKNEKRMAHFLNNLALIQFNSERIDDAINNLKKAKTISEKMGDIKNIANTLTNLGYISSHVGKFRAAKEYYIEGLHFYEKIGDKQKVADVMSNLGELYIYLQDFDKAKLLLDKSISIFEELGIAFNQIEPLNNFFRISLSNNDEAETLKYFSKMMELWNKFPSKVDDIFLKLGNLLIVAQFQEIASLKDLLSLVKEIFLNKKIKIEFRVYALMAMAKIVNLRMVSEENFSYLKNLKEITSHMRQMAQKSFSYFILVNSYIIDGNIAYIEKNIPKLVEIIDKLKKLNDSLHLEFLSEEIEGLEEKLKLGEHQDYNHSIDVKQALHSINEDIDRLLLYK